MIFRPEVVNNQLNKIIIEDGADWFFRSHIFRFQNQICLKIIAPTNDTP